MSEVSGLIFIIIIITGHPWPKMSASTHSSLDQNKDKTIYMYLIFRKTESHNFWCSRIISDYTYYYFVTKGEFHLKSFIHSNHKLHKCHLHVKFIWSSHCPVCRARHLYSMSVIHMFCAYAKICKINTKFSVLNYLSTLT